MRVLPTGERNHRNLWKIRNVFVKSAVGSVGSGCLEKRSGRGLDLYLIMLLMRIALMKKEKIS